MNNFEVLAPAGDFECLKSAILYGADAVYLGGSNFGMRANAANFKGDLLNKAVDLAHKNNVKIYLTCNTIPTNQDIKSLDNFLQIAKDIGVDALIVADIGVFFEAKKVAPNINIHISTQMGVMNYKTATSLFEIGAKRVVLAREVCLSDMKIIRNNTPKDLEIECFVHGSMCMSFSGRCLISSYLTSRDANRGFCAQPCRWKYYLVEEKRPKEYFPVFEDERGSYILNSKDLCLIEYLDKLYEAGVCSIKIEGRAKSSYYVSVITNAYSIAKKFLKDSLKSSNKYMLPEWIKKEPYKVSHRPYCSGFLFDKPKNIQFYNSSGYVREYIVVGIIHGQTESEIVCKQKNKFSIGDELEILCPNEVPFSFKVEAMFDENKNLIETAPHSEMVVYILFKEKVSLPIGSIIRKKV